jgi:hypothetical protein
MSKISDCLFFKNVKQLFITRMKNAAVILKRTKQQSPRIYTQHAGVYPECQWLCRSRICRQTISSIGIKKLFLSDPSESRKERFGRNRRGCGSPEHEKAGGFQVAGGRD